MAQQTKKSKQGNSKAKPGKGNSFNRVHIALLVIFTFVIYGNCINHYYALDDNIILHLNQYVLKGFAGIKDIFTHDSFYGYFNKQNSDVAGGRYRPLSLVTFAIEQQFFGQSPATSHFINVFLYALTAVAIYFLLKQLLLKKESAYSHLTYLPFIASLLFISLPVHTEAVANIKGRDEILAMLFSVLASYLCLKYFDEGKKLKHLLWGAFCLFMGMLSKENAIAFCAIIPLMIWFFRKATLKDYVPLVSAVVIVGGIFVLLRQTLSNTSINKEVTELMNNPFYGMTLAQRYATILFTFGKYMLLLVAPITLTSDYYPYQISAQNFSSVGTLVSLLICIAALVFAFIQLPKKTLLSFCILFFAITFFLVSNLLFPVGVFMAERFLFMPSLAFCIVVPFFIARITKADLAAISWDKSKIFILSMGIILLLYSFKTVDRNNDWKNDYTLFSADVKNSPNSAKAHYNLATEYIRDASRSKDEANKEKFWRDAIREFYNAVQIYPNYVQAHYNLGITYNYLKNNDSAKAAFRETVALAPDYTDAINDVGACLVNENKLDSAILLYKGLIKKEPLYENAYSNMATCYFRRHELDTALYYYQKAAALNPNNSSVTDMIEQIKAVQH